MKKIIYIVIILGILGAGFGYYHYNRPVSSLSGSSADISLTPNDLLTAFESNETEANGKYLDKVIQVSGQVSKVEVSAGKTSVYLKTSNEMSSVICEMEDGFDPAMASTGTNITIKGKCTGYLMDVVLVQAVVVK
ncbi:MAG: hypothetical protein IPN29_15115 [Saprospiraceae bacterium]|nr:hypothetical protein [Saprospiraceae bacterium]